MKLYLFIGTEYFLFIVIAYKIIEGIFSVGCV